MTVGAPYVSRLSALWLAVGVATVAAGCRGSDSSTNVEDVAFASRNQQFEDCCKHQFGPGRHRDECVDEARHGRCVRECQPRRDGGVDVPKGAPDAGAEDASVADGHSTTPDAGVPDAAAANCPTITVSLPFVSGPIIVGGGALFAATGFDPSASGAATITVESTGGEMLSVFNSASGTQVLWTADFICTRGATETITATISEGACHASASTNIACTLCGDGIVEAGEDCDPPNAVPNGHILCDSTCHFADTCGNGRLDPGEQCDPPQPGICGNDCQIDVVCGDGIIGPGEQCDPPKLSGTAPLCSQTCQIPTCGNGVIDPGEQCDPPKSSGTAPLCSQTCQIPTCGNGVIDPGEQCDPPKSSWTAPLCSQTCQIPTCGNGAIDPGETCDPPDGIVCDSNCQSIPIVCGNGIVQPGEQCDGPLFCNQCQLTSCAACFGQALALSGMAGEPACSSLTGTARTNCLLLLSCLTEGDARCFFQPGSGECFCGLPACPGIGQCAAQFEVVAGSTDPAVVRQQLADPTSLVSRVFAEGQAFANFPGCGMFCP